MTPGTIKISMFTIKIIIIPSTTLCIMEDSKTKPKSVLHNYTWHYNNQLNNTQHDSPTLRKTKLGTKTIPTTTIFIVTLSKTHFDNYHNNTQKNNTWHNAYSHNDTMQNKTHHNSNSHSDT